MRECPADKLRVIIVDDEELARAIIREHLSRHTDIEIAAECSNGFEAVKAAGECRPDLIFLDIQMPKLNGFEVLELLEPGPAVIFVTAYDQYALRAFEVHAADYLLKPVSAERLDHALERARQRAAQEAPASTEELVRDVRTHNKPLERVLIRDGSKVHVIPAEKIDYFEAQDDYVCIRAGGREHLKQETLANLEGLLDQGRFIRIHRSYILNIERLARIELYAKDSRIAILQDGTRLPVSRAGYARLKPML